MWVECDASSAGRAVRVALQSGLLGAIPARRSAERGIAEVEEGRGRMNQEFIFVELGDGRVMVILAEAPVEHAEQWRPWFRAILGSLEIWEQPGRGAGP